MNSISRISENISCGINALEAVRMMMEEGAAKNYVSALYCVYIFLSEQQEALQQAIEEKEG